MRLFIGLFLPQDIIADLRRYVDAFGTPPHVKWTPDSALHITLKFIGESKEENIPTFRSVLRALAAKHKSFTLQCEGGGIFPNEKNPRVFWTGIKGDVDLLRALASHLEDDFERLGFPPENRKFSPHLTLARLDHGGEAIKKFEKHFSTYRSPAFKAEALHLIRSQLTSTGSRYSTIESFELGVYSPEKVTGTP